jgi:hypothetical protein
LQSTLTSAVAQLPLPITAIVISIFWGAKKHKKVLKTVINNTGYVATDTQNSV